LWTDHIDVELGVGKEVTKLFPDVGRERRLCARANYENTHGRLGGRVVVASGGLGMQAVSQGWTQMSVVGKWDQLVGSPVMERRPSGVRRWLRRFMPLFSCRSEAIVMG
jgi:hypothetical protein